MREIVMRLLLVEDDEMIAETILDSMRRAGYALDWAANRLAAQLFLGNGVYDLVLLDLGLPKRDGVQVLNSYRRAGGAASVIILTARDTMDDCSQGLDTGEDEYLTKPFDLDELAVRVRAALRRRTGQKQPIYEHGELTLDPASCKAAKGGLPLQLAPREFALLQTFIEEPARVFRRTELEEKLSAWDEEVGRNAIEAHVHSLRRTIGADQIIAIRGVGYRLKGRV
jgi:two-component system, OmpR family, response regulator QseB